LSARGKVVWDDGLDNKLTFSLTLDKFDGGFDSYVAGGGTKTTNNEPGYTDGYVISPNLVWERRLNQYKLTSITNYARSNYGFLHDWDFSALDISTGEYDEVYNTFSQEFRFENAASAKLKWLVGAFFLYEDHDMETVARLGADAGLAGMPANIFQGQDSNIKTRAAALFGQIIYPFSSQFELTARMRVDYESKELEWTGFSDQYDDIDKSFDQSWSGVSPSLSLAWLPSENQRLYGSISTGYKAGDYNNVQVDPSVVTEAVDPEYTTTYEIGYKGLFANNRLEFNTALFYIDWRDLQVETPISTQGAIVFLKQNAAEAHSSGIELELRARPMRGWDIFAGASYMFEYEFDSFPNSSSGDLTGKNLPNANEYSLNAGALYRHNNGFFASVDAIFNGAKFFDEANLFEQESYTLLNAKIGYEADNFSVYFYGRNLLDEDYSVSMFAGAEMEGEPLVLGVQASLSY